MSGVNDTGFKARFAAELLRRIGESEADVHAAVEDFREFEPGARFWWSEHGDGSAYLNIPVRDIDYPGIREIQVSAKGSAEPIPGATASVEVVEVDGVGRCLRAKFRPMELLRHFGDGARPELEFRGVGGRGDDWAPMDLSFIPGSSAETAWGFAEDLMVLIQASQDTGSLLIRPRVFDNVGETDVELGSDLRAQLETATGRYYDVVEPRARLEADLVQARAKANEVTRAAIDGLLLALGGPEATAEAELLDRAVDDAFERALPVFEKLLGAGIFDPEEYTEEMVRFTMAVLQARHDRSPNKTAKKPTLVIQLERELKKALESEGDIDETVLHRAMDTAFGFGFSQTRAASLAFVDAVIDTRGESLSLDELLALRNLRSDIQLRAESMLFGSTTASRSFEAGAAEETMRQVRQHLTRDTGIDEKRTYLLAQKLTRALNVPLGHPHLLVLVGGTGRSYDAVTERALELTQAPVRRIDGGFDLRFADAAGALMGEPEGERAAAKGLLIPEEQAERYVAFVDNVQAIGRQAGSEEKRQGTWTNALSVLEQVSREGRFHGFDPSDPVYDEGREFVLGDGLMVLRYKGDLAELKSQVPPELWPQISRAIVDLGQPTLETVLAGVEDSVRQHLQDIYEFPDAYVELGEAFKAFVQELMALGVNGEVMQALLVDEVLTQLYLHHTSSTGLAPTLKVELANDRTDGEWADLKAEWTKNGPSMVAEGILDVTPTGYAEGREKSRVSAFVALDRVARNEEQSRMATTLAAYKMALAEAQEEINRLFTENEELRRGLALADVKVEDLIALAETQKWRIEDVERLNAIGKRTIEKLEKKLSAANSNIEKLRGATASLQEKVETATRERDQIDAALRQAQTEFDEAVRGFGQGMINSTNPHQLFQQVVQQSRNAKGKYSQGALRQVVYGATQRALQQCAGYGRQTGKFNDIAQLAKGYVDATRAIGGTPDSRVIDGFKRMAFLSGTGSVRNRDLNAQWNQIVGVAGNYSAQDPGLARALGQMAGIRW